MHGQNYNLCTSPGTSRQHAVGRIPPPDVSRPCLCWWLQCFAFLLRPLRPRRGPHRGPPKNRACWQQSSAAFGSPIFRYLLNAIGAVARSLIDTNMSIRMLSRRFSYPYYAFTHTLAVQQGFSLCNGIHVLRNWAPGGQVTKTIYLNKTKPCTVDCWILHCAPATLISTQKLPSGSKRAAPVAGACTIACTIFHLQL